MPPDFEAGPPIVFLQFDFSPFTLQLFFALKQLLLLVLVIDGLPVPVYVDDLRALALEVSIMLHEVLDFVALLTSSLLQNLLLPPASSSRGRILGFSGSSLLLLLDFSDDWLPLFNALLRIKVSFIICLSESIFVLFCVFSLFRYYFVVHR